MRPSPYTKTKQLKKHAISTTDHDDIPARSFSSSHPLDDAASVSSHVSSRPSQHIEEPVEPEISVTVPIHNTYETLSDNSDGPDDNDSMITVPSTRSTKQAKNSPPAPPPIYIQIKNTETCASSTKKLSQIANNASKYKVIAQLSGEYIALKAKTEEDYQQITNTLKAHGYHYFTYQMQRDRPIKVLLRGVPTDWDREDIEIALRDQEIPFLTVAFLQKRDATTNMKYKLPLALVNTTKAGADLLTSKLKLQNLIRRRFPSAITVRNSAILH